MNSKQLLKQAQHRVAAKTLLKQAQSEFDGQKLKSTILKSLGIGAGIGGAAGLANLYFTNEGDRREDEEPSEHRTRLAARVLGPTALVGGVFGGLSGLKELGRQIYMRNQ